MFVKLYHAYILPYLIYCIEVLGNASHCVILPLFLTQNQIIRLITFSKRLVHTEPIFKSFTSVTLTLSLQYSTFLLTFLDLFIPEWNIVYVLKELYDLTGHFR